MTPFDVIVVTFVAWVLLEFVLGRVTVRRRNKYRRRIRIEQIRSHFAATRVQLMRLARSGKVDVDSYTFRSLYKIQTFIMRRPDRQKMIAMSLLVLSRLNLKAPPEEAAILELESAEWSDELRDVVRTTSEGLNLLLLDSSWLLRILSRFGEKVPREIVERVAAHAERREFVSEVRLAQQNMNQLCGCPT